MACCTGARCRIANLLAYLPDGLRARARGLSRCVRTSSVGSGRAFGWGARGSLLASVPGPHFIEVSALSSQRTLELRNQRP
jgi:hypothetical protein